MAAISDISVPVGPHGSLLVAISTAGLAMLFKIAGASSLHLSLPLSSLLKARRRVLGKGRLGADKVIAGDSRSQCEQGRGPRIPFRTFTWTEEYPFVTFLTLRTTFDMVADIDATVAVE